ncbi:MAG: SDR family NAD(P)-dependent oxidoreductase [Rhodospirillales bacterium]
MPPKALITGASSGIGQAFALELARRGYDLTLIARREQKLKTIIEELSKTDTDQKHRILVADLSKPSSVDQVSNDIATEQYDLVINNAGAGIYKPFRDAPWEDIEANVQLNCLAVTKLSYQYLKTAKAGDALINVASIVGFTPYPPAAVYGATKAFVLSLTEALWQQYRAQDIYVMALCPGATDTEFFETAGVDPKKRPPRFYRQTSEEVVATALRALKKRHQPTVIPGWHNKMFHFVMRILNRRALVRAVGNQSARK